MRSPPSPAADYPVIAEGNAATNLTSLLLANDTDVDNGDTAILAITGVSGVTSNGVLAFAGGNVTCTPYPNANLRASNSAADAFTCTVRDALGATSNALVQVFVTGTNPTFR